MSAYVGCPDIRLTVTPDLKCPDGRGIIQGRRDFINNFVFLNFSKGIYLTVLGCLLYVSMSGNQSFRLGGSALAQCFMQLGKDAPFMDDSDVFVKAFNTTQNLIQGKVEK